MVDDGSLDLEARDSTYIHTTGPVSEAHKAQGKKLTNNTLEHSSADPPVVSSWQ